MVELEPPMIVTLPPEELPMLVTWAAAPVPMLVVTNVPVAPVPAMLMTFVVLVFAPLRRLIVCAVEDPAPDIILTTWVAPKVTPLTKFSV